ncbi:MAG TPA: fused MFS/spermidine synthase [Sedimentisphaerales bacterium]|nr:fused MFS/spermidine synthase [Sedimentisphaerales bacterium]
MSKSRSFLLIVIPSATVFISSFCIMVLELVAARLIARHLGSSLYTWTAVIGVVLAGITIGNYLGGRIADRFPARKALATLFAISSAACVVTVILNNLVGEWIWLWRFSWPARTFTHVSLVFLLPSVLLGTISPVVAKTALDRGLATGRTVGDIYAWGAAGSIAGTFAAGYYLIAAAGTVAIIWIIAATLLLMALCYQIRFWPLYAWALVFILALTMGMTPADWAKNTGAALALRQKTDPKILYQDESQYCYIAVKRLSDNPDKRAFMQDKLMHSEIAMGDILDLQYSYEQIYAAVTHRLSGGKQKLSVLVIGGGGYVFPRYVEKVWPGSRVDVAEIDPRVTEAAMMAFGLARDTSIQTYAMDARNYVDELLRRERNTGQITRYDFIYEDALNDYSIPYQLTTKEFNDKLVKLLTDDGVYMVELIDVFDSSLFLGAFVSTLEKTFPYVYVVTEADRPRAARNTFVIVAAMRQLKLDNLSSDYRQASLDLWIFSDDDIEQVKEKAQHIVLADDYAPVENLLAPVARRSSAELLAHRYLEEAEELKKQGNWDGAIARYKKVLQADPTMSIKAYNDMALILAQQGKLEQAVQNFRDALAYNEKLHFKNNMANIHYSLSTALRGLGRLQEASAESDIAVKEFHGQLEKNPQSVNTLVNLGDLLAENQKFAEAAGYFQQAVNLDPMILPNHFKVIQALELAGQLDAAMQATRRAVGFFSQHNQGQAAAALQQYLELLEFKKSKYKGPLN